MKVTKIFNSKWYRGNGSLESYLVSENGNCCLGFDGISEGIDKKYLYLKKSPNAVFDFPNFINKWDRKPSDKILNLVIKKLPPLDTGLLLSPFITLESLAMIVNDYEKINDKLRLQLLRYIFKEADTRIVYYKNK